MGMMQIFAFLRAIGVGALHLVAVHIQAKLGLEVEFAATNDRTITFGIYE